MSTGEHLLHVLNTISSRKLVLEAELKEIDEDIASNESMSRKYGAEFFTEGAARLAQSRAEKQQKLAEIKQQLAETSTSVRQGKQLLGALAENYGNMAPPTYINPEGGQLYTQQFVTTRGDSPARVLTTSPILADRRG
ncbi:hypothetical protein Ctob_015401 [Chrysochromulina tobinii]|uniref:Uncharacterized protein n=1 Tax=Chrysochromulina tobinii TaxID=1460289 RepID=A0A0M0LQM1_9EUKA|nr:hypothetical protein Ctob_015401 [Chrysochromulina tobinii]|eukprot:KOO53296.1 hypothetical protein Ctob_015401 [Chrysochromulina sp. CCMP291]